VWHAFTVAVAALFTKVAPANGATGLGSTVTLQWTAVPDEGYWVCWDTTNNNACDSGWWPNGGGTVRVLEGLSGGTYFWQVKTAGGGVLADNGAWHQFTVAASPAAVAWSLPGASRPPVRPQAWLLLAGAGLLGLLALAAGVQRRRRLPLGRGPAPAVRRCGRRPGSSWPGPACWGCSRSPPGCGGGGAS